MTSLKATKHDIVIDKLKRFAWGSSTVRFARNQHASTACCVWYHATWRARNVPARKPGQTCGYGRGRGTQFWTEPRSLTCTRMQSVITLGTGKLRAKTCAGLRSQILALARLGACSAVSWGLL